MTLALAAFSLLSMNAKTTVVNEEWNFDTSESRMVQCDAHLYVRPFVVDLELLTKERLSWEVKVSGEEYGSRVSYNSKGEILMDATQLNLKTYAVYLASVGKKAPIGGSSLKFDVLVAPLFNMSCNQYECTIEFTGYPAKYTNWKSATIDEFERWIKFDRNQVETKQGVNGTVGVEEREVRINDNTRSGLGSLLGK